MPSVLKVPDLRGGYIDVIEHVLAYGTKVAPRGQPTTELLDVIIELENPLDALPLGIGRKLNPRIGLVEALQLIGATTATGKMVEIQPRFAQFVEQDGLQWGAYGARIGDQMAHVERKLQEDPDSRQAIVTLWDPKLDNVPGKSDYPCTTMLAFFIRDGRLVMHTTMRSNDVWWGLAYDAFQFTQLQVCLARALQLQLGPYLHHAVSLHVYERDIAAFEALKRPTTDDHPVPYLGIGRHGDSMLDIIVRARHILGNNEDDPVNDPTPTEARYLAALRPAGG